MTLSKGLTEERLPKDYLQGTDRAKDGKAPRGPQEQEALNTLCLLWENEPNGKPESRDAGSCSNYRLVSWGIEKGRESILKWEDDGK